MHPVDGQNHGAQFDARKAVVRQRQHHLLRRIDMAAAKRLKTGDEKFQGISLWLDANDAVDPVKVATIGIQLTDTVMLHVNSN